MVYQSFNCIQGFFIAGEPIIRKQGERSVFSSPNIPIGQLCFSFVISYISITCLGIHELFYAVCYQIIQFFILCILV